MTDLENLIKNSRQGDQKAQRKLYDRFANQMFLVCRRYLSRDVDAEEALLDGFRKMFQALNDFIYVNDPKAVAWVKRIMINESLRKLKKENRSILELLNTDQYVVTDDDFTGDLSAKEIYALITELPENQRLVFNLFKLEGWSHREIGEMINISELASRLALHQARVNLKKMYNEKHNSYEKRKNG